MYGDKSFANLIADVNGYSKQDRPPPGLILQIPNVVNTNLHNWEGIYSVYNPAAIIGSLHPNMAMPHRAPPRPKHVSFWHVLVEAMVGAAMMAFAPELAGVMSEIIQGFIGQALGYALAGAASNLVQQSLAIGFGDQTRVSWSAVGQSAALAAGTAGIAKGLGMDLTKGPQFNSLLSSALKNVELSVATQAMGYAIHHEGHFDWGVLLASVANTLANVGAKGLNIGPPAFNEAVATASASVASGSIDAMLGKDINAEAIAASALGTFIGNQVAAQAKQYYVDYQAKAENASEFKQEIKELTHDYLQSMKYRPDEHGVFASTGKEPTASSSPGSRPSTTTTTTSNSPKPSPKKDAAHDAPYRNAHLKKDHAKQEARMTRAARWNAENSQATTSQNGLWGIVHDVADSRVLNAIITGGDAVRDRLGSALNSLGNEVIAIGADIGEASYAFGSGRIGEGLITTEDLAVKVLPFALPFEKAAMAGSRVLAPVARAVVGGTQNGVRYGAEAISKSMWFFSKEKGVESVANMATKNHISGLRLQQKLELEQASSIFNESGLLNKEVINGSKIIIRGDKLGNEKLVKELLKKGGDLSDWGKYRTPLIDSPSGRFEMHFYKNSVTGEAYYGRDYKAVFEHQGRWNLEPRPNFFYEPPKYTP